MSYFTDWLTIVFVGAVAVISPGPNLVVTLRNSLVHTRRAGVYTAMGLAVADLIHISFWLIGLGVLMSRSIWLFNLVKGLGAAYLVFIGIKSLQSRPRQHPLPLTVHAKDSTLTTAKAFQMGLLTCLLNPKVTLFFLALFTQLIRPDTPQWIQVFYGLSVAGIEFLWAVLVSLTISCPWIKQRFTAVSHWVDRVMGVMLIGLGLRLAIAQGHK